MATTISSSFQLRMAAAALVFAAVMVGPCSAQTAPTAVPVPFNQAIAGLGLSASSTCTTGVPATDGTNYGDACVGTVARLSSPQGAAVDKYGNVYIADYSDRLVRVIYNGNPALAAAITAANSGYTISASRNAPATVPVVGNFYTIAGVGAGGPAALTVTASDSKIECANYAAPGQPEALNALGDGCPAASAPIGPRDISVDGDGNLFLTDYTNGRIRIFCVNCSTSTLAAQLITLENPGVTPVNGAMYTVAGYAGGYRDAAIAFGSATTPMTSSLMRSPTTSALSTSDDVFVADNVNNAIRVLYNGGTAAKNILIAEGYTPQVGYMYTIAGSGCKSADNSHTGSTTSANSCLTTTDSDTAGLGTVPGATLTTPTTGVGLSVAWAVYLDTNGNVYYTDAGGARIKVIYGGIAPPLTLPNAAYPTLQTGYTYTFAGQGTGTASGVAPSQLVLSSAQGVGGDVGGNIFFVDYDSGLFYETYAQNGLTAIIGGGNAIATPSAGAYCNGGSTGPTMIDAYYNGCPLTQAKLNSTRGPIVADASGNLYFGDSVGYFVRKFTYSPTFPSTAVGVTSASQPYAFTFFSAATLTAPSFTSNGTTGLDFADGGFDTCTSGLAVVGGGPGTTCVVNATFSPKVPGLRSGAVQLKSAAGVLGSAFLSGSGTGSGLAVDPGTLTTTGTGIAANAVAVAVDGLGSVYVADATSKSVLRYTAGVPTTIASGLNNPSGVAVDGAGNVFFADASTNTITEIPITGTKFVLSTAVGNPKGLATDGFGNLYVADSGNNRVLMFGAGGTNATVVAFSGLSAPNAVAVDAAGNLYAADSAGVYKLSASGVQSTISTGASIGVAVDAAGDVLTTQGTQLIQFSGGVSSSVTLDASLVSPKAVVLDGAGNAFVADSGATGYLELQRTAGYYKFATSPASTTISLSSIGTDSLTAPSYSTQTDTLDFSLTPATTNPCSGALTATTNCALTASFNPKAAGTLTDIATFSSNAVNASPITLTLTGTTAAQSTSTTLAVTSATLVYGDVQTLTATVKGALSNPSDGTVNFYNNGATLLGSAAVSSGGVATLNFVPAVGSYGAVTAVYVPNGIIYLTSTSTAGSFSVTPATLTVTAINSSKVYGAANPSFTYSIAGFVNSDTLSGSVSGTPDESTTATTASSAGTYTITITQGTLLSSNYTFAFVNGTLAVTGATAQTITFNALPNVTYGVAPITLSATADSGLAVSYTATGPASISGSVLTITGAGSVTVTASQNGNNTYAAAAPVMRSFNVAKAILTFTAASPSRIYGSANPNLTYTTSGFVGTDSLVTATTGAPSESTTALIGSSVGSYPVSLAVGTLASNNYTFNFTNGSLAVTPATLLLTANNASRTYGTANPTFGGTLSGAANGDALTEVFTTSATITSPVGSYSIVPSATGTNIANYTQSATNGTLSITQAKSAITLGVSPNTGFNGSTMITLSATASSATTGTPTGSITFFAGTTSVGSAVLNGGVATYSTTSLPVGTDCITAVYAGDTNFIAVTSSCVTATIAAGFSVIPSSSALSFQHNYQEAQAFLTINPGGRTDTLTFACSGLPAKISCAFSPTTLALSGLTVPQTVQMLVSNSNASAALHGAPTTGLSLRTVTFAALPFTALMLFFGLRRRRLPMLLLLGIVTLAATAGLSGCGTSPAALQQSSGTYNFTVTVSSGSTTLQSLPFTLTVP